MPEVKIKNISIILYSPKEQLLIDNRLTGLALPEIRSQLKISQNRVHTHLKHIHLDEA